MRAILISAIVLLLAAPAAAQQPEADQVKAQSMQLLSRRDFSRLNALATQYRASGAKTANGLSKLTLFYAGMEYLPSGIVFGEGPRDDIREEQWQAIFSFGQTWVARAPSPAAYIELAKMHLRYAWERHGADGNPTPENMKAFRDHLLMARQILEGSKATASVDPNWGETLAEVARTEKPTPVPVSDNHSPPLVIERPIYHDKDEESARFTVIAKTRFAFERDDYAGLNALAEQYRNSGSKTPAGIDELSFFYSGIQQSAGFHTPSLNERPNVHQWQLVLARANKWLKAAPSPAAVIALAELRQSYGFAWRGGNSASEVRKQDWKPFFKNLALAEKTLERHKKDASVDPEWYAEMINLSYLEQWPAEKAAALYKEAFSRYPDYYPAYAAAAEAMQPKWGGSAEEFEQFADFAAANSKVKEGLSFSARVYMHVDCGCEFVEVKPNWQKMKPAFDDLVARYPAQWNYHKYARYACMAQDRQTTKAVMAKIEYPLADAWFGDVDQYQRCKTWAQSSSGYLADRK